MSKCPCGRKPDEYSNRCTYVVRLANLAKRAAKHAGAAVGVATCPCHMGGTYDPHADSARVRRAENLSVAARENARSHYAATRWSS